MDFPPLTFQEFLDEIRNTLVSAPRWMKLKPTDDIPSLAFYYRPNRISMTAVEKSYFDSEGRREKLTEMLVGLISKYHAVYVALVSPINCPPHPEAVTISAYSRNGHKLLLAPLVRFPHRAPDISSDWVDLASFGVQAENSFTEPIVKALAEREKS